MKLKNNRLERNIFFWLTFHILEFWYYYLFGILSLYLLHETQSRIPLMAKELGDKVVSGNINDIAVWSFVLIALAIIIFRTSSRLLFFYPARIQQKYLRMELLSKLEVSNPARYENFNDGQIFQTLFNDFNRIRSLVGFAVLQIGNIIISMWIFIPKVNEFNPKLLPAFIPVLTTILIFSFVVYAFMPFVKKEIELDGELQNLLIESYAAKKTIKNFNAEKSFFTLFKDKSALALNYFFKASLGGAFASPLVKFGMGVSLLWGAYIIFELNLGATSLIFFSGFLFLILEPLISLSWMGMLFVEGYASWSRIKKLLNTTKIVSERECEIQDLSSSFPSFKLPFWEHKIGFDIKPSEWIVFVGETGVGKSTLLFNIANYLSFQNQKYSLIPGEPYLYNDTVFHNIFLGNEVTELKRELALKYIKIFGLDILAQTPEDVLKLEVGENGKKVSGGQAKRIALIRSLVTESDYYLWDDPFSSVDFILEKEILTKIKNEPSLKNAHFIITSHRISSVKYCDRVILLDKNDGILEVGKPREFLKNKETKIYDFFKKQMV